MDYRRRLSLAIATLLYLTVQTRYTNIDCDIPNTECSPSLPEFPKHPQTVTVDEFDAVRIVCEHERRQGIVYKYKWYKDNPENLVSSVYNSYIFESASGSLYFGRVTHADQGEYHCILSINDGNEMRTSPPYNLEVTSHRYVHVTPIIFPGFLKIFPQSPEIGDRVSMECMARFNDWYMLAPFYEWRRKDYKDLPADHELLDYNRRLVIHDVKPEDAGEYICRVTNGVIEDDQLSITLSLSAPTTVVLAFKDPVG